MAEIIFVVEEDLEGGYHAKALSDAIFTEGETLEELKENIRETLQGHFEDQNRPHRVQFHLVKEEVFAA